MVNLSEICLNFCSHTLLLFVNFRPKASETHNIWVKTSETETKTCLFLLGARAGRELGYLLLQPGRADVLLAGTRRWGLVLTPGAGARGAQHWPSPRAGARVVSRHWLWLGHVPTAAPLAEENVQGRRGPWGSPCRRARGLLSLETTADVFLTRILILNACAAFRTRSGLGVCSLGWVFLWDCWLVGSLSSKRWSQVFSLGSLSHPRGQQPEWG